MPRAEPAIRKALEAALGDLPEPLRRLCRQRIAAFLRALPPSDVMMQRWTDDDPPRQNGPHSTVTLAAAVTAAATEDRA